MKALTWHGKGDMRCESLPVPMIQHPKDAIVKFNGLRDLRLRPCTSSAA